MPRSNDFVGRKGGAVPAMFANKDRAGDKPLFLLANTFDLAAKDYESSPLGSVLRRGGGGEEAHAPHSAHACAHLPVWAASVAMADEYKLCAEACVSIGALEEEMHQTVREKFIDPKDNFLKQEMKDCTWHRGTSASPSPMLTALDVTDAWRCAPPNQWPPSWTW